MLRKIDIDKDEIYHEYEIEYIKNNNYNKKEYINNIRKTNNKYSSTYFSLLENEEIKVENINYTEHYIGNTIEIAMLLSDA
jgi:hypothetical protein